MELVSVIIPIYNIQKIKRIFIKSITSVQKQSYTDIEIICVNDGSTDSTISILNELAKKDNRVIVINKKNGGVESARRMGMKKCNGNYIIHMDQDDYMKKNAIELFVKRIIEYNADIVVANSKRFIGNPIFTFGKKQINMDESMNRKEFLDKYFHGFFGVNIFPINIWNKIYKKSFLDSIEDPPLTGYYNEDLSYNMHVMPQANRIVFIEDTLYYYRWGGFTNRRINNLLEVALSCYNIKMNKMKEMNINDYIVTTSIELVNYINSYFYQLVEFDKLTTEKFEEEVEKTLNMMEVKEAINVVKQYDKYHKIYVDLIISKDILGIYEYERKVYRENKKKRMVKRILFKINSFLSI